MSKSGIKYGANYRHKYEMKFMRTNEQVENKLWHEIENHIRDRVGHAVWRGLRSQIANRIQLQVSDRITYQVWDKS